MRNILVVLLWILAFVFGHAENHSRLSFGVISDTHFENHAGEGAMVKVPRALRNLTSHQKLDALFVVGDMTNNGSASQYDMLRSVFSDRQNYKNEVDTIFFMIGNHDMFDANGTVNYQEKLSYLNNGMPYPFHSYSVIKGFPFITLSQMGPESYDTQNPSNGLASYPQETLDLLETLLRRACEECPGKPIFLFTHVPPKHTIFSSWPELESDDWSMGRLNPILNNYPQVVVFCGHSHYPIQDPRSIHQGANPNSSRMNYFTVVNTGSTTYSEINPGAVDIGIHPKGFVRVTEGLIVNELENNDIEIRRYDTYRNLEISAENRWVIKYPFDGSMFEYADVRDGDDNPHGHSLRNGLPAPAFRAGDTLQIEPSVNAIKLSIPQATDDECVFRYEVRITKDGSLIKDDFFFSQFYLNTDMPQRLVCTINGLLASTTYQIEVVAHDSYDNKSDAILSTFTTLQTYSPEYPSPYEYWAFSDASQPLMSGTTYGDLIPVSFINDEVVVMDDPLAAGIRMAEGPILGEHGISVPPNIGLKIVLDDGDDKENYTIVMDIKMKDAKSYNALLQTSLRNNNDADLFIFDNKVGLAELGYKGSVMDNQWHRFAFVNQNGEFRVYIDGDLISTGNSNRWTMDGEGIFLLFDDDGERVETELAGIAFWEIPLSETQIKSLGGPNVSTSINPVFSRKAEEYIYDLSGRILRTGNQQHGYPAKGVYIVKGKKMVKSR